MPQKNSSKKTNSKTTRKTSGKTGTKRTTRRTSKKPKVYIPVYKTIILCCAIITLCMGLLLITTLKSSDPKIAESVTERYQKTKTDNTVNQKTESPENPEKNPVKKNSRDTKKTDTQNKSEKIVTPQAAVIESEKAEDSKSSSHSVKSSNIEDLKSPQKLADSTSSEKKAAEKDNSKKVESSQESRQAATSSTERQIEKYNFPAAKNNAQLIFVFDDGGQNLSQLSPFLKLPFPITVAVLPQLAHSREAANQIRDSGNEVILHQPMQAVNASVNPGPGAIKPDMTESQIISTLFQNITELGPIAGMNNHEGSAITADAEKMAVVMKMCSQEGIYFLDSRTNSETQVPYVAQALGYSWYERNIFLDNEKTNANALKELRKGLDLANKNGSVIMIGHIWSADFLPAFLQDVYPELKAKGYTFSLVSKSRAKKS